jgi:hypothetical protein
VELKRTAQAVEAQLEAVAKAKEGGGAAVGGGMAASTRDPDFSYARIKVQTDLKQRQKAIVMVAPNEEEDCVFCRIQFMTNYSACSFVFSTCLVVHGMFPQAW